MPVMAVADFTVKEGQVERFAEVFAALTAEVRREPGNRLCQLARPRDGSATFSVVEIYDDDAALATHSQTEHVTRAGPVLASMLAADPRVVFYDLVGE